MPPQGGLPKFGEWDVNNPESAEGFTVIFNKARDQKKSNGSPANRVPPHNNVNTYNPPKKHNKPIKSKSWVCCFYGSSELEESDRKRRVGI